MQLLLDWKVLEEVSSYRYMGSCHSLSLCLSTVGTDCICSDIVCRRCSYMLVFCIVLTLHTV